MLKLLNYLPDISIVFVLAFIWLLQPGNDLLLIPLGLGLVLLFKNFIFNKLVIVLKKSGNYYKFKLCPAMKVIKKNKETKNIETYLSIASFKQDKPYPKEENAIILERSILSPWFGEAFMAYANNEDINMAKGTLKGDDME
jgi:hypothetical protein